MATTADFLLICSKSNAQQPLTQGMLEYTVRTSSVSADGRECKNVSRESYLFNDSMLRHLRSPRPGVLITTPNPCEGTVTMVYATNGSRKYYFEDKYDPSFFNLGLYDPAQGKLVYTEDTMTVGSIAVPLK